MSTIEKALDKMLSEGQLENTIESQSIHQPIYAEPAEQTIVPEASPEKLKVEIDTKRLSKLNFVANSQERTLISEEYRVIKRKLINNAFGALSSTLKNPNLILVTSTRPGEGKTFNSVNLALSIALEQDKTVLLIDADVLRPNVSRTLDISVPKSKSIRK